MHRIKYDLGYTRRHFLDTLARGAVGSGVLMPVWDAIAKGGGDISAAYPDEVLSIETYTKGQIKPGTVIDASNVDIVKDLLTSIHYQEIKQDGRVIDIVEGTNDVTRLAPKAFNEATDRNRGKGMLDKVGNVRVKGTTDPWIGGNPFPHPQNAQEVLCAHALSWGRHDSLGYAFNEDEVNAAGETQYRYQGYWVEVQATSRIVNDPKPYKDPTKCRYNTFVYTAPTDVAGTSYLNIWSYDQTQFPDLHGFIPAFKRIRRFPTNQRFEPFGPGSSAYLSDAWELGDPYLTWGDFQIVGKKPMLMGPTDNWNSADAQWTPVRCGGKSGRKYVRTKFSLVPEVTIVELKPVKYPRSPYSKKWLYFDMRVGLPHFMVSFDRRGQLWKLWEQSYDYMDHGNGKRVMEEQGDVAWSWNVLNCHDIQSGANGIFWLAPSVEGGYNTTYNKDSLYESFTTMGALQQLGA
jgi:hypothetical protein